MVRPNRHTFIFVLQSQNLQKCHQAKNLVIYTLFIFYMQAILQQMIVASPSVNVKSYSSKKEKSGHIKTRKRKSRDEIYVDPKEAEAASTAAKVLEEAFHQLCEMCGHYFQVGAKVINPK